MPLLAIKLPLTPPLKPARTPVQTRGAHATSIATSKPTMQRMCCMRPLPIMQRMCCMRPLPIMQRMCCGCGRTIRRRIPACNRRRAHSGGVRKRKTEAVPSLTHRRLSTPLFFWAYKHIYRAEVILLYYYPVRGLKKEPRKKRV